MFFGAALVLVEALEFEFPEVFVEALLNDDYLLIDVALFGAMVLTERRLLSVDLAFGSKEVILRGNSLPLIIASAFSHKPNLYPDF